MTFFPLFKSFRNRKKKMINIPSLMSELIKKFEGLRFKGLS
ncbi:hypothetical protein DJ66_0255 [Candidatus Liberibacter solanacearum]|uniref:Uncharacterized protein n=1 Tax=Candidatus Liberibacter solanacearum TaxID=556287 RepID=A0A0F4VMG2_9HYPH|nr:hypothetical protein DJ66_0255 [Candidatus Liberibacter solanacearum]